MITLIWIHFVADFILQSNWMAQNKSKSLLPLLTHIAVYSSCFLFYGISFALLNGALHFITDYFSSRATSYLWQKKEVHWFFVVVGLDQAIHMTCLYYTLGIK